MSSDPQPNSNPKWMSITGWIITLVPVAMLTMSAVSKFLAPDEVVNGFKQMGWPLTVAFRLGLVELFCVIIYLIPRSSVLGAILLTGYLGGAVATHVRIGELFVFPIVFGVLAWLGLFFRDERLRALLPVRMMLITIPACLVAIVLTVVGVAALLPVEYRIARSATMSASPSDAFVQVNDFHNWDGWSPWLKMDPNVKVTFEGSPSGTDAIYKWSGNDQVGEGMMTLTESVPNERIRFKLDFKKPYPSSADTEFTFKADKNKTIVTQTMTGKRDLMAKTISLALGMDHMIGGKFDEGLTAMKAIVEAKPAEANKK